MDAAAAAGYKAISRGESWEPYWVQYDSMTFDEMVADKDKVTYEDFYGDTECEESSQPQ